MADILDSYIKKINGVNISQRINDFINTLLNKIKLYFVRIKIQFEIIKIKLELLNNYINLGKYISKYYNEEKIKDFSYQEKYFILNQEINKKKRYIKKLKNIIKK